MHVVHLQRMYTIGVLKLHGQQPPRQMRILARDRELRLEFANDTRR
jgi:hypothetical protein